MVIAGLANLAIAVAKLVAGLLSHSAAMLSEAAHSLADTVTEVLLYAALRRGAKPADPRHPFGHGKESYVWAFIASIFTFVAGAGFSITHGFNTIRTGEHSGQYTVAYVVLAASFAIEGVSFLRAWRQVRESSKKWRTTPARFLRLTPDTTVKAVFLEDSAALVGILLAAGGIAGSQLTGDELWDGLASIAIGLLLLAVAAVLARSNISLLVGRAVPDRMHTAIHDEITDPPAVMAVETLLTMQLGPEEVLVAAKVDFADDATGADIEATADEVERRLIARYPMIRYVFLDPTRGGGAFPHTDFLPSANSMPPANAPPGTSPPPADAVPQADSPPRADSPPAAGSAARGERDGSD